MDEALDETATPTIPAAVLPINFLRDNSFFAMLIIVYLLPFFVVGYEAMIIF